jgi:hypothetical protein
LRGEYDQITNKTINEIGKWQVVRMKMDGATNIMGKQVLNLTACGSFAYFRERFVMELRLETSENLLDKLVECKRRLLAMIRDPIDGYALPGTSDIFIDIVEVDEA